MVLRAYGSTDATVGSGKVRKPGGGRGNGNGKGGNGQGGGGGGSGAWDTTEDVNVSVSGAILSASDYVNNGAARGTVAYPGSGSKYFEITIGGAASDNLQIGLTISPLITTFGADVGTNSIGWRGNSSIVYGNNFLAPAVTYTTGDVLGVGYNNSSSTWYKNGTLVYTRGLGPKVLYPGGGQYTGATGAYTMTLNTQGPFLYLPSGFSAWE